MTQRKRRWVRWLVLCLVILLALVAGLIVAGKYWIAPAVLRGMIASAVAEHWDGSLEIGQIRFRYFGITEFNRLRLLDRSGRVWLEADRVGLGLSVRPEEEALAIAAEVDALTVRAYFSNGRCEIPLSPAPTADGARRYETGSQGQGPPGGKDSIRFEGVTARDVSLLTINETPQDVRVWGDFALRADGTLPGASLPATDAFWPIALSELHIPEVTYAGRELAARFIKSGGEHAGKVRGSFFLRTPRGGPPLIECNAVVLGFPWGGLLSARDPAGAVLKGTVAGTYVFEGPLGEDGAIAGRGKLTVDDADVWTLPVLGALLRRIQGARDPLAFSDMKATFDTAGPVMTFRQFQLANRLSALEIEPGGTINLADGRVDLHVTTVLLADVRSVLRDNPVANLFVGAGDRFTRLHITGRRDVAGGIIIRKDSMDFASGTAEFFQGAARTGGQLTLDATQAVTDLLTK